MAEGEWKLLGSVSVESVSTDPGTGRIIGMSVERTELRLCPSCGDYNSGGLRDGQPAFSGSAIRDRQGGPDDLVERQDDDGATLGTRLGNPRFRAGYLRDDGRKKGQAKATGEEAYPVASKGGAGWPLDKSLCLIPELYRIALVYGFNPLTGRETPRWRARNVVRWVRPNPPVGALADKFRNATSEMVVACTGRKRYFDLDAVRVPFTRHGGAGTGVRKGQDGNKPEDNRPNDPPRVMNTHAGAPPLDWWLIPTEPYAGSHYATFPRALCVRPIEAMCPRRVCTVCGKPSERIVDVSYRPFGDAGTQNAEARAQRGAAERGVNGGAGQFALGRAEKTTTTTGWTDCECPGGEARWRPGLVLDCFGGSGTVGAVATGHSRNAILIDLDERNADLAAERIGMWMDVAKYDAHGSHLPEWLVSPEAVS